MSKPTKKTIYDHEIVIDKDQLSVWLLCYFRYSLRRHTYVVGNCCDDLRRYWAVMPKNYRKQIIEDIERYLEHDLKYEHQCDITSWKELLEFAKKNLEAPNDK